MHFPTPLIPATLVKRYKRFLADVTLANGDTITVHCPNSGAMMGVAPPGAQCWISSAQNPKRKLRHTLEIIQADGAYVGINTQHPNALAAEAIANGIIEELQGHDTLKREQTYHHGDDKSRFDIALLTGPNITTYVEVKNVHLMRKPGLAEFPDSVTSRGAKHLSGLAHAAKAGLRAVQLYIIQRDDCETFALATDIDPAYAAALHTARAAGVEILAYACAIRPNATPNAPTGEIVTHRRLAIHID